MCAPQASRATLAAGRETGRGGAQELLEADPAFMQPGSRRNEVMGWVAAGLRDFSISRSAAAMPWGIPLPMDPSHTTYVWCAPMYPFRYFKLTYPLKIVVLS